jgi:DNA-binding CsgD family transcriptional regulator
MTTTTACWPWTLPEDGILDPIAIELAARGIRPVALTPAERLTAAARILAKGGTPALIARRLHVSGTTALILAARIQHSRMGATR